MYPLTHSFPAIIMVLTELGEPCCKPIMEAPALGFQRNAFHFIVCLLVCDEFHGLTQVAHTVLLAKDVTLGKISSVLHNRLVFPEKYKCHLSTDDATKSAFFK